MTPERYERLRKLFAATCELLPRERRAVLDRECAGDPSLRTDVEALLARDVKADSFLKSPILGEDFSLDVEPPAPECNLVGERISHYRITRVIAAGGMGTVYEAEQDKPKRSVAIKIMRRGMASHSALRRFEYEAQILARLPHPGIAQVFEAGSLDDGPLAGVPYFVMEYIPDARPITRYVADAKLGTRDRLALFAGVCDAVDHGHQKAVIHRDLKPDNILVDAAGKSKIIDFGVARATDSDMAVTTLETDVGQIIGTLRYMSPEQCRADPLALDTRSDVYALGVVLYELLCGQPPYEVSSDGGLPEAVRVIREESPRRPSTVDRALRGDLETIALKALEKEPERRYQSVSALADDVRRFLENKPIQARPPTLLDRMAKWSRRHRSAVVVAVALLFMTVIGLTISAVLVVREQAKTKRALAKAQLSFETAEEQRQRAEENFQNARDAVDRMLTQAAEKLADVPHMEQVRRALLEDALEFYQGFLKERSDDPAVRSEAGRAYRRVSEILGMLGELSEAKQACLEGIALQEQLVADFPHVPGYAAELAKSCTNLAGLAMPVVSSEEEAARRRAISLLEVLTTDYPGAPDYAAELATNYTNLGGSPNADKEAANRKAIPIWESLIADHPEVPDYQAGLGNSLKHLGDVMLYSGRWDDAEVCYERILAIFQKLVRDHPDTRRYREGLTWGYHNRGWMDVMAPGRLDGAEEPYHRALTLCNELIDDFPGVPNYRVWLAHFQGDLANVLTASHRFTEAETERSRQLALEEALLADFPDEHSYWCAVAQSHLATAHGLRKCGRAEAAVDEYRRALDILETATEKFPTVQTVREMLINCIGNLVRMIKTWGKAAMAEGELGKAVALIERLATEFPDTYQDSLLQTQLVSTYACLGAAMLEAGQTDEFRDKLRQAATLHASLPVPVHYGPDNPCLDLGIALFEAGLTEEAKQVFREDVVILEKQYADAPHEGAPYEKLARLLVVCPDPEFHDPARAAELASTAIQLEPENGWCWNQLGKSHYRLGDWQAAIDAQEKAFELLGSQHAWGMFYLAMAHWQLGDKEQARTWYERALELKTGPWGNAELHRLEIEAAKLLGTEEEDMEEPNPGED